MERQYLWTEAGDSVVAYQILSDPSSIKNNVATSTDRKLLAIGDLRFVVDYLLQAEVNPDRSLLQGSYIFKTNFPLTDSEIKDHLKNWLSSQGVQLIQSSDVKQGLCITQFEVLMEPIKKYTGASF
jgi:hypothetical protein